MKTRIQKWGNSLAVRIPKAFADDMNFSDDSEVDLSIEDNKLVVSLARQKRRRKYKLRDLVDQIKDEHLHPETDWGPPVGNEVW